MSSDEVCYGLVLLIYSVIAYKLIKMIYARFIKGATGSKNERRKI